MAGFAEGDYVWFDSLGKRVQGRIVKVYETRPGEECVSVDTGHRMWSYVPVRRLHHLLRSV